MVSSKKGALSQSAAAKQWTALTTLGQGTILAGAGALVMGSLPARQCCKEAIRLLFLRMEQGFGIVRGTAVAARLQL